MTSALNLFRWRRVLAFCAASAALHVAVIGWGAGQAGPETISLAPAEVTVVAELRSAPAALPEPPAPAAAGEAGAALPEPPVQLPSSPEMVSPVAAALAPYKANLPPSAQLTYSVLRVDAGGARSSGSAVTEWQTGRGQYQIAASSDVAGSTLMALGSEGTTGAGGMVPRKMNAQRRGKAATATHFNARTGRITFSASEDSVVMAPGTQDRATLPLQLAGIARAAGKLGTDITLMVAEEKGVSEMRFTLAGQENIDTPLGTLATWRLSYSPAPDSYRSQLEVWLAPAHEWYPVQIRSTEANGAVTTQTISRIVANEVGN